MPPVALSSSIPFRGTQQYWNAINQMVEWLNAKAFPPKEALKVYYSCNLSRAFCLPLPWLWVSFRVALPRWPMPVLCRVCHRARIRPCGSSCIVWK